MGSGYVRQRQRTYRVSGRIVDGNRTAVVGAIVVLDSACHVQEARTGRDGRFKFRRVVLGEYVLEVRGPGFLPVFRYDLPIPADLGDISVSQ